MMCTAAAPRSLTARITWGYELSIHNQMSERPRGWKGWGVVLGVSSTTLQKMHVKSQIIKNKCKTHKCNDT